MTDEILDKRIDSIKVLKMDGTTLEFEFADPAGGRSVRASDHHRGVQAGRIGGDDYGRKDDCGGGEGTLCAPLHYMDPTIHGGTLRQAFAQPWSYAGFETDQFKPLAGNQLAGGEPAHMERLYVLRDDDVSNFESDCACSHDQTTFAGTAGGLIALGHTADANFADEGTCGFQQQGGVAHTSLVRKMWVKWAANPERCLPDWLSVAPRYGEVLPESDAEMEVTFDCSKKNAQNGWTTASDEGYWLKFRTTPSEGNDAQPDPHVNAYGLPPEGPNQAYSTAAPEYNIMAQVALVCPEQRRRLGGPKIGGAPAPKGEDRHRIRPRTPALAAKALAAAEASWAAARRARSEHVLRGGEPPAIWALFGDARDGGAAAGGLPPRRRLIPYPDSADLPYPYATYVLDDAGTNNEHTFDQAFLAPDAHAWSPAYGPALTTPDGGSNPAHPLLVPLFDGVGARIGYNADADTTMNIVDTVEVHTLQIRAPTGAGSWLWDIKSTGLLKLTSSAMLPCFAGAGDASESCAAGYYWPAGGEKTQCGGDFSFCLPGAKAPQAVDSFLTACDDNSCDNGDGTGCEYCDAAGDAKLMCSFGNNLRAERWKQVTCAEPLSLLHHYMVHPTETIEREIFENAGGTPITWDIVTEAPGDWLVITSKNPEDTVFDETGADGEVMPGDKMVLELAFECPSDITSHQDHHYHITIQSRLSNGVGTSAFGVVPLTYTQHEGKHCAGADSVEGLDPSAWAGKTLAWCKAKCSMVGEDCTSFEFHTGGAHAGTCQLSDGCETGVEGDAVMSDNADVDLYAKDFEETISEFTFGITLTCATPGPTSSPTVPTFAPSALPSTSPTVPTTLPTGSPTITVIAATVTLDDFSGDADDATTQAQIEAAVAASLGIDGVTADDVTVQSTTEGDNGELKVDVEIDMTNANDDEGFATEDEAVTQTVAALTAASGDGTLTDEMSSSRCSVTTATVCATDADCHSCAADPTRPCSDDAGCHVCGTTTCMAIPAGDTDAGYADSFRGWYDVQGCGECNDYCRWVGNCGSGGDPAVKVVHACTFQDAPATSIWSCRLAGGTSHGSGDPPPWHVSADDSSTWTWGKCSGEGAAVAVSGPLSPITCTDGGGECTDQDDTCDLSDTCAGLSETCASGIDTTKAHVDESAVTVAPTTLAPSASPSIAPTESPTTLQFCGAHDQCRAEGFTTGLCCPTTGGYFLGCCGNTDGPTDEPTHAPTESPSIAPTASPTKFPTGPHGGSRAGAPVASGAESAQVQNTEDFNVGDRVRFGGLEDVTVTDVATARRRVLVGGRRLAAGTITFEPALQNSYEAGATVDVMTKSVAPTESPTLDERSCNAQASDTCNWMPGLCCPMHPGYCSTFACDTANGGSTAGEQDCIGSGTSTENGCQCVETVQVDGQGVQLDTEDKCDDVTNGIWSPEENFSAVCCAVVTGAPSGSPTNAPSVSPTKLPTEAPTGAPVSNTLSPTASPSVAPTNAPSASPTSSPTTPKPTAASKCSAVEHPRCHNPPYGAAGWPADWLGVKTNYELNGDHDCCPMADGQSYHPCCDNALTDGPFGGNVVTSEIVAGKTEGQGANTVHVADTAPFKVGDAVRVGGLEDVVVEAVAADGGAINGATPGTLKFTPALANEYPGGTVVDVMARSGAPSVSPTTSPTGSPSTSPTGSPTKSPSKAPTEHPTEFPTRSPTSSPSKWPTGPEGGSRLSAAVTADDDVLPVVDHDGFEPGDTVRIGGLEDRIVEDADNNLVSLTAPLERGYPAGASVDIMRRSAAPTTAGPTVVPPCSSAACLGAQFLEQMQAGTGAGGDVCKDNCGNDCRTLNDQCPKASSASDLSDAFKKTMCAQSTGLAFCAAGGDGDGAGDEAEVEGDDAVVLMAVICALIIAAVFVGSIMCQRKKDGPGGLKGLLAPAAPTNVADDHPNALAVHEHAEKAQAHSRGITKLAQDIGHARTDEEKKDLILEIRKRVVESMHAAAGAGTSAARAGPRHSARLKFSKGPRKTAVELRYEELGRKAALGVPADGGVGAGAPQRKRSRRRSVRDKMEEIEKEERRSRRRTMRSIDEGDDDFAD